MQVFDDKECKENKEKWETEWYTYVWLYVQNRAKSNQAAQTERKYERTCAQKYAHTRRIGIGKHRKWIEASSTILFSSAFGMWYI